MKYRQQDIGSDSQRGSAAASERVLPVLDRLPRPLFVRAESLAAGTFSPVHAHDWAQLSYAIDGVLDIRTPVGNHVALAQCAVWIPAGIEHQVVNPGRAEMRSFYLDPAPFPWSRDCCRVLQVTPLVRELIRAASVLRADYPLEGAEARLVQVLIDQLLVLPEAPFSLPIPQDKRLRVMMAALHAAPDDARTLAQWAGQLGTTERNLVRLFRRETGLTFRLWRQRMRLMLSLNGLEAGHAVTRVALDYGYDSPSSYIAAFKQLFGRTPGGVRG